MIIKVCGMTLADNIRQIEDVADWLGFIFYEKSPRHIKIQPDYLPQFAKRVGVFVNESIETIKGKVEEYSLDIVQLHGKESESFCETLKKESNVEIIKAFGINQQTNWTEINSFKACNYLLFDTSCDSKGGSGKSFDWKLLDNYQGSLPFLLSGGISEESIEDLSKFHHQKWIGIDINSKFEITHGIKDASRIRTFISQIRKSINK